ncbi:MAG: hypothetical protein ACQEQM_05785 [Thermoplasmatota archaeon]
MEAENVSQLKYMLEMELKNLRERADIDLALFIGVGGRIFATSIPDDLKPDQYRLLNTFKGNLTSLCSKLKGEDLEVSIERWKSGMAIVAAVGGNSFLASLLTKKSAISDMGTKLDEVMKATTVLKHIFEQKDFSEKTIQSYPEDVQDELNRLTRQLFVDRFTHTKSYKKNEEILEFMKDKIKKAVGVGQLDQIVSVTFNEMGTSAPYMEDDMWYDFLEKVVDEHLRSVVGDIQAERYKKQWKKELGKKLKTYL